jgi:hypothetical protein
MERKMYLDVPYLYREKPSTPNGLRQNRLKLPNFKCKRSPFLLPRDLKPSSFPANNQHPQLNMPA